MGGPEPQRRPPPAARGPRRPERHVHHAHRRRQRNAKTLGGGRRLRSRRHPDTCWGEKGSLACHRLQRRRGGSLATTAPEPPHPKATFPRRPPALGRVPKRLTVCACPCVCGSESLSLLLPLLRSHPFHLVARNAPEAPAQTGGAGIVLFCLVPKLYK